MQSSASLHCCRDRAGKNGESGQGPLGSGDAAAPLGNAARGAY